jgi:hypothetical protein
VEVLGFQTDLARVNLLSAEPVEELHLQIHLLAVRLIVDGGPFAWEGTQRDQ